MNEMDRDGQAEYLKLNKAEFLEFLARIAELNFKDTEMEEIPLFEKIEHLLNEILPLIGAERVK